MEHTKIISITYHPKKVAAWEDYAIEPLLEDMVKFITHEPDFFLLLCSVMREYRDPDVDTETMQERIEDIQDKMSIAPSIKHKKEACKEFMSLINKIYSGENGKVDNLRGRV